MKRRINCESRLIQVYEQMKTRGILSNGETRENPTDTQIKASLNKGEINACLTNAESGVNFSQKAKLNRSEILGKTDSSQISYCSAPSADRPRISSIAQLRIITIFATKLTKLFNPVGF